MGDLVKTYSIWNFDKIKQEIDLTVCVFSNGQIAISRLATTKIAEQEVAYFGEQSKLNYVYSINLEK